MHKDSTHHSGHEPHNSTIRSPGGAARIDLPQEAIEALERGQKIQAIAILRESRGLDLTQAKSIVDEYVASNASLRESMAHRQSDSSRVVLLGMLGLAAFGLLAFYTLKG